MQTSTIEQAASAAAESIEAVAKIAEAVKNVQIK
jgi:hypothetical protein